MTLPIRVLHVDDEPDLADLAAAFLEREDDRITVETATSVSEGLERLAQHDFDAVVSDYEMPRQNGIAFLEAVREEYLDLPFILYTGKGSEEVASDAIAAGVTEYLQKEAGTSQYTILANRISNAVEQYRARHAVEETEQKLSLFTEKTDDILFMFTGDWSELLFVNSAYEEISGAALPELRDDPGAFVEYIHPADREEVLNAMNQLSDGTEQKLEFRVQRPDGTQRWVRGDTKPVLADDGTVSQIVGFVRDITTQKEREHELQEERAFIEQALDTLGDVFYVVGPNGEFHRWNTRLTEATDYTDDEIADMKATEIFPDDEHARIESAIAEAITDGDATIEADVLTATGERIPYELTGTRLSDPEGELIGLVGTGRDIAERKARERDLRRERDRLEEFASVVSHDLRNPLNVATGRLALARAECDSIHLDDIARAHERMEGLVSDLLTLARDGKHVDKREVVDLAALSATCWQNVATAEATLVTKTDHRIQADRSRLQQLLENLLRNAVDHGGEAVTVTVGSLSDGFYVEDNGPGLLPSERELVFDAGYSTSEEGTGFGLAIVEQIAHAHGWDSRIAESEVGGARFEFTGIESTRYCCGGE